MVIKDFPPLNYADENGLLALGGDLSLESLILAYSRGIFPWPVTSFDIIPWFSPPKRTVLFFDELHISKSLKKELRRTNYTFRFNCDFEIILEQCAVSPNRGSQNGTWLTKEMSRAYLNLHRAGYAHSVGCYDESHLIGGLYGVSLGRMFAGESMFYKEKNASKFCFVQLIDHLSARGFRWLDCQVMTPLAASFGAREISRVEFVTLLEESLGQANADGSWPRLFEGGIG